MKSVLSLIALSSLFVGSLAAPTLPVVGDLDATKGLGNTLGSLTGEESALPVKKDVEVVDDVEEIPTELVGGVVGGKTGLPIVGKDVEVVDDVTKIPTELVGGVVGGKTGLPIVGKDVQTVKTEHVVETFKGLIVTVKQHTGAINQTVDNYSAGDDKSVVAAAVSSELTAVVSALSSVVDTVGGLSGVMSFSTSEVDTIAGIVFEIVHEVVATVFKLLSALGIQDLLSTVISDLTQIISQLVSVVIKVVGGVADVLDSLVGFSDLLDLATGLASGLPLDVAGSKLAGITGGKLPVGNLPVGI